MDKQGNLVIIENKLDDSGKDVTWQAIKYASYCSSLTKQEILKVYQAYLGNEGKAEDNIVEFFDGKEIEEILLNQGLNSQRLILIAAKFRKEVTSSVLWLMNFKLRIQCFKVTPFVNEDQLLLNIEQILPTKDAEEFVIGIASKAQEEEATKANSRTSHNLRKSFWEAFLVESNKANKLFSTISPTKDNWIGIGIGMSGVNLSVVISKKYCRSEIYFNRGNKEENKDLFDFVFAMRERIETEFGDALEWERMDDKVTCRIKIESTDVSYFEKSDWPKMIQFMIESSAKMVKAFSEPVKQLNRYAKTGK